MSQYDHDADPMQETAATAMAFIGRQRPLVSQHLQRTPGLLRPRTASTFPVGDLERCWQAVEHQLSLRVVRVRTKRVLTERFLSSL